MSPQIHQDDHDSIYHDINTIIACMSDLQTRRTAHTLAGNKDDDLERNRIRLAGISGGARQPDAGDINWPRD
jgi:hypothetical protein